MVTERTDGGRTWAAWMRGTAGMGIRELAGLCPELGGAVAPLEEWDQRGFAREASSALGGPDEWEERAFVAYRMAIQRVSDSVSDGSGYDGGMPYILQSVYGRETLAMMLYRCLRDLPTILRIGSVEAASAARSSCMILFVECMGAVGSRDDKLAALEAAADALDAVVSASEGVPGAEAESERTSILSLFLRMLSRTLEAGGSDEGVDSVSMIAYSAMVPRRWEDGTSRTIRGLLSVLCSAEPPRVTAEDLERGYLDMRGFCKFGATRRAS